MSYVYYKSQSNQQVYGYDTLSQQELINQAIANGWEDVSGSWPPPIPPIEPKVPDVTAVQIRLMLNQVNLRAQVETAVAAGSQDLKDKWEYGTTFSSTDSDIQAMATMLGLNQKELDILFTNAASL
jgi:hypothetical protein